MSGTYTKISMNAFRRGEPVVPEHLMADKSPEDARLPYIAAIKGYLLSLTQDFIDSNGIKKASNAEVAARQLSQPTYRLETVQKNEDSPVNGVRIVFNLVSADKKTTATLEIEAKPKNHKNPPDQWGDVTSLDIKNTTSSSRALAFFWGAERSTDTATIQDKESLQRSLNAWLKGAYTRTKVPPPSSSTHPLLSTEP